VGDEERQEWTMVLENLDEWSEVLANIVSEQETISSEELVTLMPEIGENEELLEAIQEYLELSGVGVQNPENGNGNGAKARTPAEGARDVASIPTEDLLDVYLADVSQEQLLTHEDEIALAQQIEMGRLAEEALREGDYNNKEYRRLQALVEAGQAAREHLGSANTRLVISIAKRYRGYGIPFPDLIQDGNVGLMRAVDHYDHRTGNRFSTYATWWIRQAVTRSLANHGRVIRIPVHTGARMRKMAQVSQRLEMEKGQRPTVQEIATAMDETPDKIRQMMRWSSQPISLEQPVGDEGDAELQDFVEDGNLLPPEDLTDSNLLHETLGSLIDSLSVREAQILRLRYGLQDTETHTLGQIGQKFGLSRERIRQIEREALAKLRLVAPRHQLEEFL
jgi:RNA polymerase primary sigma factor